MRVRGKSIDGTYRSKREPRTVFGRPPIGRQRLVGVGEAAADSADEDGVVRQLARPSHAFQKLRLNPIKLLLERTGHPRHALGARALDMGLQRIQDFTFHRGLERQGGYAVRVQVSEFRSQVPALEQALDVTLQTRKARVEPVHSELHIRFSQALAPRSTALELGRVSLRGVSGTQ
jgi:hypothetical protein